MPVWGILLHHDVKLFQIHHDVRPEVDDSAKARFPLTSLRKLVFALQILRRYLTKEGRVLKSFYYLIWIKEHCVRKFEGLTRSKLFGISQVITHFACR